MYPCFIIFIIIIIMCMHMMNIYTCKKKVFIIIIIQYIEEKF